MALTEEQKQEIRESLDQEDAESKKTILSSVENFANWLQAVAKIVVAIQQLITFFNFLRSLFL